MEASFFWQTTNPIVDGAVVTFSRKKYGFRVKNYGFGVLFYGLFSGD
jgi:hypothetical protein